MGQFHSDKKLTDAQLRRLTDIDCSGDDPLVKQEFLKDSDVNVIIARCLRTGSDIPGAEIRGAFADVTAVGDFVAARERILVAEKAFMELPALLRRRFANDPAELIAFIADDRNREEAIQLGLVKKPESKASEPPVPSALPAGSPPPPAAK